MNTYLVRSDTNYGEVVHIVNADNEEEVKRIVADNNAVWDGYTIEKINTEKKGLVASGGGGYQ